MNPEGEVARQFCKIVIDRATKEKLASEGAAATEMAKQIDARLAELKSAIEEHEQWLKRREDFKKKARDNLVRVFASMSAEAAAARLAVSEEEVAAAILTLMAPKLASAALSEMPPEKAARLTSYMAGAASVVPTAGGAPEAEQR